VQGVADPEHVSKGVTRREVTAAAPMMLASKRTTAKMAPRPWPWRARRWATPAASVKFPKSFVPLAA